jgi:hypothetical protein
VVLATEVALEHAQSVVRERDRFDLLACLVEDGGERSVASLAAELRGYIALQRYVHRLLA